MFALHLLLFSLYLNHANSRGKNFRFILQKYCIAYNIKQLNACNYLRGYNETQEVKILDLYYKKMHYI